MQGNRIAVARLRSSRRACSAAAAGHWQWTAKRTPRQPSMPTPSARAPRATRWRSMGSPRSAHEANKQRSRRHSCPTGAVQEPHTAGRRGTASSHGSGDGGATDPSRCRALRWSRSRQNAVRREAAAGGLGMACGAVPEGMNRRNGRTGIKRGVAPSGMLRRGRPARLRSRTRSGDENAAEVQRALLRVHLLSLIHI